MNKLINQCVHSHSVDDLAEIILRVGHKASLQTRHKMYTLHGFSAPRRSPVSR